MKDTSSTITSRTTDLSFPLINNYKESGDSISTINQLNDNDTHNISIKWSLKEKLFLISFVMINGDSNWSYVSEQLNSWIQITSTYNFDSKSMNNQSNIVKRTPKQCSKQYKFIIKNYILKTGYCDLRKIYNDLVDERLKELKKLIIENKQQYSDLSKEIEQILSMDVANFEQLVDIWNDLKNEYNLSIENEAEDSQILNKNLKLLLFINEKKKKEELERKEREKQLELERQEMERKRQEQERELEVQRKEQQEREAAELREKLERELKEQQEKEKSLSNEKPFKTELPDDVEMKDEQMDDDDNKKKQNLESDNDRSSSSEDDIPLLVIKQQQQQKQQKSSSNYNSESESNNKKESASGIEWKPVVAESNNLNNLEDKSNITNETNNSNESVNINIRTRRQQSLRSLNKPTTNKKLGVIESFASSSSPSTSSSSDHENIKSDDALQQAESSSPVLANKHITRSSSKLAATKKISNLAKNDTQNNNNNNNEDAELIFTPLIKCDKDEEQLTSNQQDNESESDNKRLKRNKKKIKEEEEQLIEQDEDDTSNNNNNNTSVNRSLSLRSKLRSNQQTSQAAVTPTSNKRKSVLQPAPISSTPSSTTVKDSGLVSIIKSEPVQLSSSSIISSNDDNNSEEAANVPNTRSKSHQNESNTSKFEDEKAYRAWKKSIMMVLNNISCHKHATIFMQPVKEEIAPGYKNVIHRPMDLSTVKKNIENGSIKSTSEFQRDIMLMFTNAFMYNSSNHDIHKITLEMYKEVLNDIEQLLNAQETMGENEIKPLRFKDIRSSTASDRGADNDKTEDANEIVVNLLMKSKKEAHNLIKDDIIETSSIKSSSSISTPLTSNSNSNSANKSRLDTSSVKSSANTQSSNSRKRRPSVTAEQKEKEKDTSSVISPPNQSKSKRRKSGR